MIEKINKVTTPLCFLSNGRLVCYQYGDIIVFEDDKEVQRHNLLGSVKERLLGRVKLTNRLLRLGVRAAFALPDNTIILSIGNMLYELDVFTGVLSEGFFCGEGIRPLQFSEINGVDGFKDGIYFGGYVHNPEKKPVSIYCRTTNDKWETVYTFPQGAINHVHNIIPDHFRNCLWIFTGDFGEAAAIWKVTDNFNKVERLIGGDQRWRGSVSFVLPEGLLYATDTPRADDYLYLLNPDTLEQKIVTSLHGSCIYGCIWKDNYVLSSTVESEGGDMSFFENWLGRKRGKGIKDEYVHMYCGNLEKGFFEIYKERKDWLPFTLFQFGVFKFPAGVNNGDTLYFQPIATNTNDLSLMAYCN